jgi:hypothetical protein
VLSADFGKMIDELNALLMGADETKIKGSSKGESGNENKAGLSAKVPGTGIGAELTASMTEKTSSETQSEYTSRKIEALHRNIMRYQELFARLSNLASGPSFLLLDDLYHLRLNDQANVVDYFQSRFRKSAQDAKWSFCLTAGTIGPRIRSDHEQTSPPESLSGLQGEGGAGSHQGRPDDSPTGRAFRRSPQSDYGVEIAA